jgi:hypothetical protein
MPERKEKCRDYQMIPVYPDTKKSANELRRGGETWNQFMQRIIFGDKK